MGITHLKTAVFFRSPAHLICGLPLFHFPNHDYLYYFFFSGTGQRRRLKMSAKNFGNWKRKRYEILQSILPKLWIYSISINYTLFHGNVVLTRKNIYRDYCHKKKIVKNALKFFEIFEKFFNQNFLSVLEKWILDFRYLCECHQRGLNAIYCFICDVQCLTLFSLMKIKLINYPRLKWTLIGWWKIMKPWLFLHSY